MKVILASNNKNKLREFKEILEDDGFEIISQSEAGLALDVDETGETFAENAFLKAEAACKMSGKVAISDDSGLAVDALNGEPGVHSARYGGGNLTDEEKCDLVIEKLRNSENRRAKFISSIACVFPNGDVVRAEGECQGVIADAPKGSNGFGYDPIFYVEEYGQTMAELTADEKNAVSHRGKALANFKAELNKYLTKEVK